MFAKEKLDKNCDNVRLWKLGLVKTGLKALIANMLYIKTWAKVLTLILFGSVSIISIHLVRAYFWIFFYKFVYSRVRSKRIFRYIVTYIKILKKLISGRKSPSKLALSLTFPKQW